MTATVPSIKVRGTSVTSTAASPRHMADTCASWSTNDRRAAKRLLKARGVIHAKDATARAALLAMSLDILTNGGEACRTIKADYGEATE